MRELLRLSDVVSALELPSPTSAFRKEEVTVQAVALWNQLIIEPGVIPRRSELRYEYYCVC